MVSTKSITFDGVNDYIDMGDVSTFQKDYTDAFSISCWAKTVATASVNTLVGKMTSAVGQRGYLMFLNASGQFEVVIRNTEITNSLRRRTVASRLNDGGWHHFVMTYDGGGDLTLYVDGVNKSTTTVYSTLTSTILASKSLQVGAYDGNTAPFAGNIDEVAFFDDELTGNEVLDIFSSARPADLIGSRALAAWWKFGENVRFPTVVDMVTSVATYPNIPNEVGETSPYNYSPLTTSIDLNNDTVDESISFGNFSEVDFEWSDPFTLSVWVKFTAGSNYYVMGKKKASTDYNGYLLNFDSSGNVKLSLDNGPSIGTATWGAIGDGAWHHVLVISDGSGLPANWKCYIDGVDAGAPTTSGSVASGTIKSTGPLTVGSMNPSWPSTEYVGKVCHSAVWDKALSPAEVAAVTGSVPQDLSSIGPTGNLVHWAALGDGDALGAGNILDISGNGNHGTFLNGEVGDFVLDVPPIRTTTDGTMTNMTAANIVQWAPSSNFSRYCYDFDGSNDYITMGNVLGFEYTDSFSVSCWINTTATSGYIVSKMLSSGNFTGWGFVLDSAGRVNVYLRNDNSPVNQIRVNGSTTGLNDGNWHHIIFTWQGNVTPSASDLYIYVDGQPETEVIIDDSLTATIVSVAAFTLGSRNAGGDSPWAGKISEVAIYNKALDASEAQWIYNNGAPRDLRLSGAPSNLEAWWRIGEGGEQPQSSWVHKVHQWVWDAAATKESATITDASHLNSPGTLYNMDATNVTTDTPGGISEYSCTFNGVDEGLYCNVASTQYGVYQADGGTQLALSAWVKTTASTGWICGNANNYTGTTWVGYGLYLSSGRPQFRLGYGQVGSDTFGSAVCRRGNNTINDGTWKHVLVTHRYISTNNHEIKIWVNGVEQATTLVDNDQSGSFSGLGFSIGALFSTRLDPFAGSIDEVSVWSKFFTQDDVDAVYNSGAPCDLRDVPAAIYLRGWWRMGDAYSYAGTTVNMDYQDKIPNAPGTTEYSKYSLTMATNDYVSIPHSADIDFDYDETFSISSWVFPLNLNTYAGLWYKKSGVGLTIEYYGGSGGATYDPRGSIRILFDGTTGLWEVYPGGSWSQLAVPYGEWFHFVMTHDGSSSASGIKCYINGEEVPVWVRYDFAFPGGDTMKNSADLWLGRGAAYWLGNQDEVSAWNKELTQAEVTEMYNSGDPSNLLDHSAAANLIGWWQMGDGPGNDGTMTNMASDDVIANAPRKPTVGGTKIDYYLMRGVDSACGSLTYHHWTVTGAPDFTGAQAGTLPCGGPLTDIIVEASWSVFN